MKKYFGSFLALAVMAGVMAGCGNNKSDDKLLAGVNNSNDSSSSGTGSTGGVTTNPVVVQNNAKAAGAAQVAGIAAKALGNGLGVASPAPRFLAAPVVLGAMPTGMTYNATTDYYEESILGGTFGIRFETSGATVLHIFDDNADAALAATVTVIRVKINGADPAGNTYVAAMADSGVSFASGVPTTMHMIGTVAVTAVDGSTFNLASNVIVDSRYENTGAGKGAVISGTETGTGTLSDGASVVISLTFVNGVADGFCTVTLSDGTSTAVSVHLNPDGTGTYTDSTGTHTLS